MRKSLLLYTDNLNVLDVLTDEQAGVLFKAIRAKVMGTPLPDMDGMTRVAFCGIEAALDRDAEKYKRICERNAQNGRKGGRPKKTQDNPENPVGNLETQKTQTNPKNPTKADNDNDNDNDNDINIRAKRKRFTKPTVEEVRAYCEQRKNGIDPERFINFYEAKDWMIGKNRMKDWKAAVRTWEQTNKKQRAQIQERNAFNRFDQNQYDFDQLEKDLGII